MQQLGADSQGRISYEQFLNRRLALRPEIDALKVTNKDNISDNSQGKYKLHQLCPDLNKNLKTVKCFLQGSTFNKK